MSPDQLAPRIRRFRTRCGKPSPLTACGVPQSAAFDHVDTSGITNLTPLLHSGGPDGG